MFHTGKNVLLFASLATSALLFGCGGGSSSDSGSSAPYAYYIDAAVSGIHYVCGTHEGDTDADGKFYFQEGSTCTFSLADITLKSLETEGLDSGSEVQETDATIARILQSLDTDSDDDTITISEETIAALATAYSEESEDDDSGDDSYASLTTLLEIVTEVVEDAGGTMVSEEDAIDHLLSNALAGATLYDVGFNDGEILYQTLKFDDDLTSIIWTNILNSEDTGTATFNSLDGSVLSITSDDEDMEFNLELVENDSSFYIKMTEVLADSSTETAEVEYLFPTMAAAKSLLVQEILTGNTVYAVNVTETSMESWQFNDDLTTGTWTDTDGESGTDTIEYEDLILYATDEEGTATITFSDITEDYLTATADSGSETTSLRIYLSESLATTYLTSLSSNDSSDDTSSDDSDDDSSSDDGTTDDSSDSSTTIDMSTLSLAGQTWYTSDFYAVTFDTSSFSTVNLVNDNDDENGESEDYSIVDGSMVVDHGDGTTTTITLLGEVTGGYKAQLVSEEGTETLIFYTSQANLEANLYTDLESGATLADLDDDDSTNQSNAGFELTSLSVQEIDDQLQITLSAEGNIKTALEEESAATTDYQNVLWVEINDTVEFGYDANGNSWCVDDDSDTTISSCTYEFDGTDLILTIDADDIPTNSYNYLSVQAEIAEESTLDDDAENYYDSIYFGARWSYGDSTSGETTATFDGATQSGTAVFVTDVENYDGDTDYTHQIKVASGDEPTKLSADVTLNNLSVPTDGVANLSVDLRYSNDDVSEDSELYAIAVRARIKVTENTAVIRPYIQVCLDAECDDTENIETGLYNTEISPEAPTTLMVEWDADTSTFNFAYGNASESIALSALDEYLANYSYTFEEDYSFQKARIKSYFSDVVSGDDFSSTAYVDNVYVNDELYDDFSSDTIDTSLWTVSPGSSYDGSLMTTNLMNGVWTIAGEDSDGNPVAFGAVIAILNNGSYIAAQQTLGENGVIGGIEVGPYTLTTTSVTGDTVIAPLDADDGIDDDDQSNALYINSNVGDTFLDGQLTYTSSTTAQFTSADSGTDEDDEVYFTKIEATDDHPEAGAWINIEGDLMGDEEDATILILDGNGNYMHCDLKYSNLDFYYIYDGDVADVIRNATEFGTYEMSSDNSTITFTPSTDDSSDYDAYYCDDTDSSDCDAIAGDSNAHAGFSDASGVEIPVSFDDSTMSLQFEEDSVIYNVTTKRVE